MNELDIIDSDKEKDVPEEGMSFLQHLEELRWRLLYAVIGIVIGMIVCWLFIDFLVEDVLLVPAKESNMTLINLRPFGQLMLFLQVAFIGGIVLSIPNVFFQIWKFISPALYEHERKYVGSVVTFSSVCFITGVVFAYYVMLPLTLKFAVQFGTEEIENTFSVTEYFSIIISVMLAAGVLFELPMLSFFLSKIGILTPGFMRKYRRHAIVTIMILAAVLSPGGDPVAQMLLALPIFLLYELSILVSKLSQKNVDKK